MPHCVCPLHSTSHPLNLILEQQTQLSVAGNRSDIAVLPKKIGKLAKVETGQKGCGKFGKEKVNTNGKSEIDSFEKTLMRTAAYCFVALCCFVGFI